MRQLTFDLPTAPQGTAPSAHSRAPASSGQGVGEGSIARDGRIALTPEQELAVSRRQGSMLLTAAAGSGKTSVLVERYVRAVSEDGLSPARILAITFTERAAWELRERVRTSLQQLGLSAPARDTEAASVGTIHAFCARLLRADPLAAGLAPGFRILDEAAATRLRDAAFTEALAEVVSSASAAALDAAAAYGPQRLRRIVLSAHSQLRSRGQASPRLPSAPAGFEQQAVAAHALLAALMLRFDVDYEARKREREAVDFDDLELGALRLLDADPEAAWRWAQRFDMVMVDEFQDVNRRQLTLLQALERENLFTVGDEWQSIYSFRNADVEIFRRRSAKLAKLGERAALTCNFRSRPELVESVNAAFSRRFGERFEPLIATRERVGGCEPAVEVLLSSTQGWERDPALATRISEGLPEAPIWRHAEARLLGRRLASLVADSRARPEEIVVLLRSCGDLAVYEAALRAQGLPTASATADLWDSAEVQDALAALCALANPLDSLALCGLLASPAVGLGGDALGLLGAAARARRRSLWSVVCEAQAGMQGEHALATGDQALLECFRADFVELRREAGRLSLADLVHLIAGDAMRARPSRLESQPRRASAAIHGLARVGAELEALEGRDLRAFIEHLKQLEKARVPIAAEQRGSAEGAVQLMSIHAAKGLEFPVVCIADLGRVPGGREVPELLIDGERVGLRVPSLDGAPTLPAGEYQRLSEERDLAAAEEEDRILYVAMTRAKEMLLVCGAANLERWPKQGAGCAPIAWLAPALVEDLPERLASAAGEAPAVIACDPRAGARVPACVISTPASTAAMLAEPESCSAAPRPSPAGEGLEPASPTRGGPVVAPVVQAARPQSLEGWTLSYTALSQLERCGYRFHLERMIGLQETDAQGRSAASVDDRGHADRRLVGEVAHRLLERIDWRRAASGGANPDLEQVRDVGMRLGAKLDAGSAQEIVEMLAGLSQTSLAGRLAACRAIHAEQPFCFALRRSGRSIAGTFDAICVERGGRVLVVDYKTDLLDRDCDLEHLVARDYQLQRLIYALAALRDGASEVEVAHWFLRRPQEHAAAVFHASQLTRIEAMLQARVQAALERGFAVSEDPHRVRCARCPGRSGLCSWPRELTLREPALSGAIPEARLKL